MSDEQDNTGKWYIENNAIAFGFSEASQQELAAGFAAMIRMLGTHDMDAASFCIRIGYYLALQQASANVRGLSPTVLADALVKVETGLAKKHFAKCLGEALGESAKTESKPEETPKSTPQGSQSTDDELDN